MNASCGMSALPNCRILLRSSPEVPTEHMRCDDGVVPLICQSVNFGNSQSITPAVTGYLHRVVAQRPHGPGVARFGEDQIRPFTHKSGGVRAEVDVCFAIKATWLLRSSDMTRWAMKGHSLPQVRTLLLEVVWECAREKFAISVSVDAAPAAVKAAQSSAVMLVSRLTINIARKSLPVSKPPAAIRPFRERSENEQTVASGRAAVQRKLL
ncbi:hypothetical protein V1294_000124 [Bradyrhizobium sp. AZCC 1678]|uniref:hypothetical protein n=1 Tax=Bradyrhizobium sp. AZCC 1678 TaxID=3117030 RepID=UPI002FF2FB5D